MKLETWMRREGVTAQEMARRAGLEPITIRRLLAGKHYPQQGTIRLIELATDGMVRAKDHSRVNGEQP